MPNPTPDYAKIHSHLMAKAARDPEFRRNLMAQPKATVEQELAVAFPEFGPIPEGVKINVIEHSADNVTLVLPPPERPADHELTDGELKQVVGTGGCYGPDFQGGGFW